MAEENLSRSMAETGKESSTDPSPLADRDRNPRVRRPSTGRRIEML
jgi:hypothetical protein